MSQKKLDAITARDEDFAKWYTDVCRKAELMDYSSVKGCIIYRPYGYAIWELIQKDLDARIKETGHENVYLPMFIPSSLFQKEKDHVEGFAPECAIVTQGGSETLEDPLIIRPTSEVLFCEHFSKIVNSYRDLPIKYNQWCSVVRWEKTTRPFLRGSEFLWQEGHTIHETKEEAREETLGMLDTYAALAKELLAIPMYTGKKTDKEKFSGAEETYTIEAMMHDGKALQSGTTHYFGQGFAKAFNIQYLSKENKQAYVHQTSWGLSTRLIGAIIMVHGDDNGLVLPPYVAPTQIMIIPVQQQKPGVLDKAFELKEQLKKLGYRVSVDASDKSPGWKFSDAEMKGIPIRIELGPKDIEKGHCVVVNRIDGVKQFVLLEALESDLKVRLETIHQYMYDQALKNRDEHTYDVTSFDELKTTIQTKPGYVKAMWCGDVACEEKIKEETTATSRCLPFDQTPIADTCVCCQKKAKHVVYFAKAY